MTLAKARLYNLDFVDWVSQTAQLLREERFDEVDLAHLIEEVEDLGNRHRDAIDSQLTRLLMHLLKWQYQANRRSPSWESSIRESRKKISRLLRKYPSLQPYFEAQIEQCYQDAVEDASDETGLPSATFPSDCLYGADQILSRDFLPSLIDPIDLL
jgi:Domain of unknown function DUF29